MLRRVQLCHTQRMQFARSVGFIAFLLDFVYFLRVLDVEKDWFRENAEDISTTRATCAISFSKSRIVAFNVLAVFATRCLAVFFSEYCFV